MQTKSVKFILCSIIFALFCINVQAQRTRAFANEAGTFVEELRKYYKEDKNLEKDQQKDYEALLIQYEKVWLGFSTQKQAKIIRIANSMLNTRVRPYSGFYNFIKVQVDFRNSTQSDESYEEWLDISETLLQNKKTRDFTNLIETSLSLISSNCLYESRTAKWTSSSSSFYFKLENNTPVVVFDESMDLTCSSLKDSNIIMGTKGVYYLTDQKWIGKGGKVFWTRTDIPENKCWAELNKYEAITKFSKFSADSALFMNTDYFKKPLLGRLDEDLGMPQTPERYSYPRFKSYQKDYVIKNIFPDIDYSGGFSMNGPKFIASGVDRDNAVITISRKGKPFIVVEGKTFFFNKDRINSESVAATLYLDNDSIFNAGLQFRYVHSSKEVVLLNDNKRNYCSPFENTYHKLDMYCDAIYWKIGDESVDFSTSRASGTASFAQFESQNYFSESRYNSIRGIDNLSPLERVRNYCISRKTRSFYIDEFTAYIRMDPSQAKLMLHNLAQYGFLNVNNQDEFVYVKQKLFDFSKSNSKAIDYDAITLSSALSSSESNATLDLKTNDLRLRGVEKFVLSDTQNVVINPTKQELVVKKNRDLLFDGRIMAGRFDMMARNNYFSYEKFKIDMKQIDSLRFYVTSFTDNKKLARVRTPLQNLKAELIIDRSDNKASLKHLEEYPILNSLDYSYAYYEEPYIQNGVYTQKRFYYKLDPFTIKKLFKFETDSLIFSGVLNSANIFPEINEPLKVQPDYSLGFVMKTPPAGLSLYGGKGHYYETIDLSYKGLLGRGKVEYLASETRSRDIIFMPDSMHAVTDTFLVREQYAGGGKTEFPDVKVGKSIQRWYPYENKMYVYQDKDPFQMYKGEMLHHGYLLLTPVGMSGSGISKMGLAEVVADKFDFKQTNLNSNESEFKLQATDREGLAFYGRNVKSKVDFKTRKGEFVSNDSLARVVLPVLQYAAYIDKFTWEMDKAELALANSKSESSASIERMDKKNLLSAKIPGTLYVSTNLAQDSLHFFATKANFKYKENLLTSDQVFLIRVADAAIFPNNKKVSVKAEARMEPLVKATIIADTAQKYHQFYDANVQISGSKSYLASGYIDYIDENKAKQKIFLSKIEPTAGKTTGTGNIGDSAKFLLSPAFAFKGEVIVEAQQLNFTFNGGIQLTHNCKISEEELAWMRFCSVIIPDSIYIPVPEIPTDFSGDRATASVLFKIQSMQPYAAFLTKDKDVDNEIISASGFLTFNKRKAEYQIGSVQKLSAPQDIKGNLLTLNQVTCDVKGEGRLRFGLKQDHVKTLTFGSIKVNNKKNESDGDISLGIKFPFAKKAIDFMAQNIFEDLGMEMMDYNSPKLKQLLREYVSGDSKVEKLIEELTTMGDLKHYPEELDYTVLLTGIKLKYDSERGYTYSGSAGLVKAGDKQQYKNLRAGLQLQHKGSSNILKLYIEVNSDHWYYFSYEEKGKRTTMKAYSSLGEFNDMIKAVKPEERKFEAEKNGSSFEYLLAIPREKDNFIRAIQGLKIEETTGDEIEEEEILNDGNE